MEYGDEMEREDIYDDFLTLNDFAPLAEPMETLGVEDAPLPASAAWEEVSVEDLEETRF